MLTFAPPFVILSLPASASIFTLARLLVIMSLPVVPKSLTAIFFLSLSIKFSALPVAASLSVTE